MVLLFSTFVSRSRLAHQRQLGCLVGWKAFTFGGFPLNFGTPFAHRLVALDWLAGGLVDCLAGWLLVWLTGWLLGLLAGKLLTPVVPPIL